MKHRVKPQRVFVTSHLLVTRPSKSRALECFVVEISQRSTHVAMLVCDCNTTVMAF